MKNINFVLFLITHKNASVFLVSMPINLPYEAQKAQREYEEATFPGEKLKKGEAFLKEIPKHKGTANMRAQLKQALAKIRSELDKSKKKQAKRQSIFVKKHGAAQICVIGFPNTGKSYLLNNLTNIKIDSTNVPFETAMPEIAMANFEDIQFQMVEIPSLTEDFRKRPHGAEFMNIIRHCDLILILLTKGKENEELELIKKELDANSIIIERKRKDMRIHKMLSGGINIIGKKHFKGDLMDLKKVLQRHGIHNAEIILNEDIDVEDLVDSLDEGVSYKLSLITSDLSDLKKLVQELWDKLRLIRVYTKEPRHKPEKTPIVLKLGSDIEDVGKEIHKDFISEFRFARVFGKSAKFKGQMVGLSHEIVDKDIVEFHLK